LLFDNSMLALSLSKGWKFRLSVSKSGVLYQRVGKGECRMMKFFNREVREEREGFLMMKSPLRTTGEIGYPIRGRCVSMGGFYA
jgi:hypothetical protein